MKKKVYGRVYVTVTKELEIDDLTLAGLDEQEVEDIFIEIANEEFGGISSFVGNGGTDKIIGVTEHDESIYEDGEVEFYEVG